MLSFAELDPELELALGVDANTEALATSVAANDEVVANENDVLDDNQSFALDRQTDGTEPADSELEVQPSGAQDYE